MQNLSVQNCPEENSFQTALNNKSVHRLGCNGVPYQVVDWDRGQETPSTYKHTHTHYLFAYLFNILRLSLISPKEEPKRLCLPSNILGGVRDPREKGGEQSETPEQAKPEHRCSICYYDRHLVLGPAGSF